MNCEEAATPDPVDLLRDEARPDAPGLSTLTLQIEAFEHKDGVNSFCLAALAGKRRVGFTLELRCSALAPLTLEAHDLQLQRCDVRIKSTGEESDHFVSAVAAVYDLEVPVGHMPEQLDFHALCIAGDPGDLHAGPLQLLLLYSGQTPARRSDVMSEDFQWLLRIDVPKGEAGFVDRTPDNHRPIVAALSGSVGWRH